MRALAAALLLAPSLALAEPAPGTPWPAGSLQREDVLVGVLLVHLTPGSAAKAPEAIARLAPVHMPGFPPVKLGEGDRPVAGKLSWGPGEEEFGEDEVRYFAARVAPELRGRLVAKHPVTILAARGPSAGAGTLRAFTSLVGAVAAELGTVVYDLDTRDLWDARHWADERTAAFAGELPVVDRHITVHNYRVGDGIRSVTLGMSKLGLPDVVIEDGQTQSQSAIELIHAVCQWMVEHRSLADAGRIPLDLRKLQDTPLRERLLHGPGRGAVGAADVSVAVARREEGDAPNPLMALTFEGFPGGPGERQLALLTRLFGDADPVMRARPGDPELAAASRRAREGLPRFKEGFARRAGVEHFSVKVPFRSGRDTEYMWLEVRSWKGEKLEGVLQDEPYVVKHVRRGARVEVAEKDVYDWKWQHEDGTIEGDETSKVLERRQEE